MNIAMFNSAAEKFDNRDLFIGRSVYEGVNRSQGVVTSNALYKNQSTKAEDSRTKSVMSIDKRSDYSLEKVRFQRSGRLRKFSHFDEKSLVQLGLRSSNNDTLDLPV